MAMLSIKEKNENSYDCGTSALSDNYFDISNVSFLFMRNNKINTLNGMTIIPTSEINDSFNNSYNISKEISIPDNLLYNLRKLNQILQLKDDWDNCGAKPFKEEFIDEIRDIIIELNVKVNVFPLSDERIQLGFKDKNGNYMEMYFSYKEKGIEVLSVINGIESADYIKDYNMNKINNYIKSFYGQ